MLPTGRNVVQKTQEWLHENLSGWNKSAAKFFADFSKNARKVAELFLCVFFTYCKSLDIYRNRLFSLLYINLNLPNFFASGQIIRLIWPKSFARVHSFDHFEKLALLKARTFSLLLNSARFEKRELLKSAR
jgi:hypothetical protein